MGVLIFANLFFLCITILAHTFLDSFEGSNTTVSEDMLNERAISCKGHADPNAAPEVVIDVKVSMIFMGSRLRTMPSASLRSSKGPEGMLL